MEYDRIIYIYDYLCRNTVTKQHIEKCMKLAGIYGVTIDSLIKTETVDGTKVIPPAPKGKNIWGSVIIN